MADSVTVDQGGTSITTNTMSEADLRTEMEAPAAAETNPVRGETNPVRGETNPPGRDPQGRFAKTEPATAPAETPAAPEPAADTEPAARRKDDLPRHNPIARLNQALAQKAEADRRAAALEAELARYRQPAASSPDLRPAPPPPSNGHAPTAEPQFEQFAQEADPYTAYLQAWTRWDRAQGIAQARAEWDAQQATQQKAQAFQARLADGKVAHPDFDNVLQSADTLGLQVSAVMQEAIADSPHAADLVYYLATHPEECTQLAEESVATPVAAATVMRRLLESHLAPRAAPSDGPGSAARAVVSTAKPPVRPVGSSPVVSDEPPGDSASAAEHARYWNRRLKVPGTR